MDHNQIPQELEDFEDSTIGPGQGDIIEHATAATDNMSTASSMVPVVQPTEPTQSPTTMTTTTNTNTTSDETNKRMARPSSSSSMTTTSFVLPNFDVSQIPREARSLLAGGIAGMVAKSVVAPMDRIKILYQVSSAEFHFRSLPQVMRNIVQTEGLAALWKGNLATMIRVFPYSGIQFMVFDACKRFFLMEQQKLGHSVLATQKTRAMMTASSATVHNDDNINNNNKAHLAATTLTTATKTNKNKHGLTALESLVGGMIAGCLSMLCTYPLDLTRAQLAVLKRHKRGDVIHTKGFWAVLTENYTQRGVVGLFRGVAPSLMGVLPYSGIAFTLNEQGKRRVSRCRKTHERKPPGAFEIVNSHIMSRHTPAQRARQIQRLTQRDLTTMERMQCGAFSGLVAQSATYPIEVTRRRMQTRGLVGNDTALGCLKSSGKTSKNGTVAAAAMIGSQPSQPESLLSTIRHLYAEQGLRGFFKGVAVNWMKGPVAFSISFTTFDTVQGLMESNFHANKKQHQPRADPSRRQ